MDKYEVEQTKGKYETHKFMLKVLVWFIGLSVIGVVVCVILAVLRVAIEAMIIIGGILIVLALIGIVGYNAMKL